MCSMSVAATVLDHCCAVLHVQASSLVRRRPLSAGQRSKSDKIAGECRWQFAPCGAREAQHEANARRNGDVAQLVPTGACPDATEAIRGQRRNRSGYTHSKRSKQPAQTGASARTRWRRTTHASWFWRHRSGGVMPSGHFQQFLRIALALGVVHLLDPPMFGTPSSDPRRARRANVVNEMLTNPAS